VLDRKHLLKILFIALKVHALHIFVDNCTEDFSSILIASRLPSLPGYSRPKIHAILSFSLPVKSEVHHCYSQSAYLNCTFLGSLKVSVETKGARNCTVGCLVILEHLRKRQRPESKNSKKEDVEGPEKHNERVKVVMVACKEECLDCFSYMEGRGDGADDPHEEVEVGAQVGGKRSKGKKRRKTFFWADERRKREVEAIGNKHLEQWVCRDEVSMIKV